MRAADARRPKIFIAVQNRAAHSGAANIPVLLFLRITEKFELKRQHEQSCADEYRLLAKRSARKEVYMSEDVVGKLKGLCGELHARIEASADYKTLMAVERALKDIEALSAPPVVSSADVPAAEPAAAEAANETPTAEAANETPAAEAAPETPAAESVADAAPASDAAVEVESTEAVADACLLYTSRCV